MLKSMTGFGCCDYRDEDVDFNIEVKTLNHRYRDYFFKIPKALNAVEEKIKNMISQKISRGRIECSIKFHEIGMKKKKIVFDRELANHYIEILNEIKDLDPMISDELSLSLISMFPDIISMEEEGPDTDLIWGKIKPELTKVLDTLDESRIIEGESLKNDIVLRNKKINSWINDISKITPESLERYRHDLKDKINTYVKSNELDQRRLLTEVAIMADKLNIDEELIRLESHSKRLEEILNETDPVGRKLDFLIQEMNREINTIGSKANDLAISNLVVDIKSEIEKIREQIQNIE